MASFTSNPSQFNPYISQLPLIETMSKVGREKQAKYDQGIQRIQSQIDSVAGLEVIRDIDKQYLQSKMNDLGNNLKYVAAGDFSNYQLTNAVGGMVNKVSKDENIQNAVYSTMNHKKQLTAIEQARKNGEMAPENEQDYQKKFNAYYTSNKVGEQFSSKYTPYIDVNKKIIDIAKEVGIDEVTAQQLFQTDSAGKILTDKDGVPIYNPIMIEQHLKGKDPAKILNAFRNALTPADYNQLAITGRYMKGNLSEEQLAQEIRTNYSSNIKLVDGKLEELKLELLSENSKKEKDRAKIESIIAQGEFFRKQKFDLEASQKRDIGEIANNPDGVRASLYTSNYLAGMARSLASSTKETTSKINPHFEVNMRLNEFARQVAQDKIANQHWDLEQARKDREFAYKVDQDQKEFDAKYGPGPDDAIKEGVVTTSDKFAILNRVNEDYLAGVEELNSLNKTFALELFKTINPRNTGEHEDEYQKRLLQAMENAAASKGIELSDFVTQLSTEAVESWAVSETGIPLEFQDIVKNQRKLTQDLEVQQSRMQRIKARAKDEAEAQGAPSYAETISKIPAFDVRVGSDTITLSAQDQIDLVNAHPYAFNELWQLRIDKEQVAVREVAVERLTRKFGPEKLRKLENVLLGLTELPFGQRVAIEPFVMGRKGRGGLFDNRLGTAYDAINGDKANLAAEIEAKLYIEEGYVQQPISYALQRGKQNEDDFNKRVAAIVSTYSGVSDTKELLKAIISGKPYGAKVIASPGISDRQAVEYTLLVTTPSGDDIRLPIDAEKFQYLSGKQAPLNEAKPQIIDQLEEYGTTGKNGSSDPASAWFSNADFVNVKNVPYTVTGNFIESVGNPNNLIFRMYLHDKSGVNPPIVVTYDKPIPKKIKGAYNQALSNFASVITPAIIEQLNKTKQ